MKRIVLVLLPVAFFAVCLTVLLRGEQPQVSETRADENSALQAQVDELERRLEQPCARCVARDEAPAPETQVDPEPTPAPAAKPRAAPTQAQAPRDLKGWLASIKAGGRLPAGFFEWAKADRSRLRAIALALGEVEDPRVAAVLADVLKKTALKDPEVQKTMLAIADSAAPLEVRKAALDVLAQALFHDPLAAERISDSDRQDLIRMAEASAPEVRAGALTALAFFPTDPNALGALSRLWNDPGIPEKARNTAVLALRFAPEAEAFPVLLEAITTEQPVHVRQQAAASLVYLNPQLPERREEAFRRLAERVTVEKDWLAKGFSLVALMQFDHDRAAELIRALEQTETDPWEKQRYAALAEIAGRESDYQRIVHQGIHQFRLIEARKQAADAPK